MNQLQIIKHPVIPKRSEETVQLKIENDFLIGLNGQIPEGTAAPARTAHRLIAMQINRLALVHHHCRGIACNDF